jgi:hypothetical protein
MKTKTKQIVDRITNANALQGIWVSDNEILQIEEINKNIEDEDDILIQGKGFTIFVDELEDADTFNNTLNISNRYIIHIK